MSSRDSSQRYRPVAVQMLWVVYFLDFIYSGVLRGFLPTLVSNGLYFMRAVVVVLLLIIFLQSGKLLSTFSRFFVFLSFLLTGFQLILFINNQVSLLSFIYGIYLYVVPLLGIVIAEGMDVKHILSQYYSILRIALPLNFLVSILQTVFKFAPLYSAGFGAGLYSSGGIQRATGTFSSSVGLSLFISLAFILLISVHLLKIRIVPLYIWLLVFFLVLISGSRTTFLNFGLLMLGTFMLRNLRKNFYTNKLFSRIFWVLFFLVSVTFPFLINVYSAGINRFKNGNEINPPLQRLLQQISLDGYQADFFGEGLGTRALGSIIDPDQRILFANWIEFDNARILVEAGVFFFVLIWIAKILYVFRLVTERNRLPLNERTVINIGLIGLCPYLFFAQIFGQGTLSSGVFLLMYVLLSLTSQGSSASDHDY
jgi:hypothetical protein